MSSSPLLCVVDANVGIKIALVQPLSDRADRLFTYLESDKHAQFYIPDFFYAECAHTFAKYTRLFKYSAEEAKRDMLEIYALRLESVPTSMLAKDALEIAITHRIAGYDACYVALSQRIKAPLVTADEKLVRAMTNTPYDVQSLATFDIPPIV